MQFWFNSFLISVVLVSCSVPGPVLKQPKSNDWFNLPETNDQIGVSTWSFTAANAGYKDIKLAELLLYQKSILRPDSGFELRIVAKTLNQSLRIKKYVGNAFLNGKTLTLQADRCYIYGKEQILDKLVPLEGWNCDHLEFQFEVRSNQLYRKKSSNQNPSSADTDWFYMNSAIHLSSYPASKNDQFANLVWAGQLLTKDDQITYFGYDASRFLRPNDQLLLFNTEGKQVGSTKILQVIDDIVVVEPSLNLTQQPPISGILTSRLAKSLFE